MSQPGPGQGGSATPTAMPPARTPRRTRATAALGIVLALLLTAVGVLAVRDALLYAGLLDGRPLLHELAKAVQGLRPQAWTVVVGALLGLLGLALLVKALIRSGPKVATVTAATGVFLRPRDVSRLVETAAEGVDGVLGVRASATARRVAVTIRSNGDEGVAERVHEVVTERLEPLATRPTVRVTTERRKR
ncbi:DUF6286 domain-containing protein [Terrabacter sp. NPDC080008]|uniref:DUF6286 domain-containing protein n=1 Tax=Terrabacter sp. NPDC080008 TaxID=3155176 RepID=UPI00344F03C4